ncbi:MAG: hypothetical protein IPJ89_04910 [Candidatus Iainarchaeum archaeon]|uniref:Uncharacterized protein n=1 Tax=Candidatus Iainarchaeum sp. TaxID=3101447 RepID=A0A7T9DJG1_9ARCH|nr:MAG: hypothetical protein IPJ89_04910 [Candidatus Diapherotrites archaeon]
MPQRQFTKLWGLKKLKKIAQGLRPGLVTISPYLVRPTNPHLRPRDIGNSERLLVRTDEKGKRYDNLAWSFVPRYSINTSGYSKDSRRLSKAIEENTKKRYDSFNRGSRDSVNPPHYFKHLRHIIHPTHGYSNVYSEGIITIAPLRRATRSIITIVLPYGAKKEFTYDYKTRRVDAFEKAKYGPEQRRILSRLLRFLRYAIQSNQLQIKPTRFLTLRYLTWKDAPTIPEFYDLQEYREVQSQAKKKREKITL